MNEDDIKNNQEIEENGSPDPFDTDFNAFLEDDNKKPDEIVEDDKKEEKKEDKKEEPKEQVSAQSGNYVSRSEFAVERWLDNNPEFGDFADKIRKVAADPRMGGARVEAIVGAAVGVENAMKIAAKSYTETKGKANENKPVGRSTREPERGTADVDVKPIEELTEDEWKKIKGSMGVA